MAGDAQAVSIHAPAWGATGIFPPIISAPACFNPRPRVGGDPDRSPPGFAVYVSIHAPAWGATLFDLFVEVFKSVSIHAPAWGATGAGALMFDRPSVSIHAPAWGATVRRGEYQSPVAFQSTPPRGGRRHSSGGCCLFGSFQSTPPRGGRLDVPAFNSFPIDVSIHAPAWGATKSQ